MLTLYGHPLSSYTQKVLIALYELGTDFEFRHIDLGDEGDRALMLSVEPMGRMPALREGDLVLSQSSLMIEWLDRHHPGPQRLLDPDPDASLPARQWDRFLDFQVMQMMQQIVDARIFMAEGAEERVAPFARGKLDLAYAALDRRLDGRDWIAGGFGLADCAAMPALFYAGAIHPFADHPRLTGYFERLVARPSVQRVIEGARPFYGWFPFKDGIAARFL
ncbi:glutathione S-transferase family protein [Paracoccus sp. PS-1]|uniref:glutathione S-transferase family protein n=1 Tax=unclassified Paracoccus (in: a-proteobacteria) TaxID=2688777 RepID=UPI0004B925B4|nr:MULTISPECIES: glutathione S-transferase family protein [unclassified Paracoccus (in: a-proteobacteria)]MDQ7260632.1 glutathione S-transferase family protein [Paracoccus sp. PS1]UFM65604.1 glutathione S-transferase family protein [Paracoccus sp. MA]